MEYKDFFEALTEHISEKVVNKLKGEEFKPQETQGNQEQYFTSKEAREFLKISSATTLSGYVKKGFIPQPSKRGGRQLFYKKSDLEKFLAQGV